MWTHTTLIVLLLLASRSISCFQLANDNDDRDDNRLPKRASYCNLIRGLSQKSVERILKNLERLGMKDIALERCNRQWPSN